ncbi:MAG: hypothetical protein QF464_08195, partial [Myxococcota bacterium]|nr:hypothetical protein [Myxococcota bacterium]
ATLYRGLAAKLDNLEIRGLAKVTTSGDVLVLEGDLHSGDESTFEVEDGASFTASWLDLGGQVTEAQILGDITTDKLTCADCP